MKYLFLFMIICSNSIETESISHEADSVSCEVELEYVTINSELDSIVQAFVRHEVDMDYYSSDLILGLDVVNRDGGLVVFHISSSLRGTGDLYSDIDYLGYTEVSNHLMLIVSADFSSFDEYFKSTSVKALFCPKKEELEDNSILNAYEDDTFTYWDFILRNGKLERIGL